MKTLLRHPAVLVAALLAVVAGVAAVPRTPSDKVITAYFAESPGLYPGDSVRVLGVEVGKIESITPEPGQVKAVLRCDPSVRVPADARAAIVSPTLVSSRFVQLVPAYRGGPELPADATIPRSRTVTPVEWDTTVDQLTQLTGQLGPGPGETTGPLGRALDSTYANLNGQGNRIHDTIRNTSAAMTTLAEGAPDLFGTVRNLQAVVTNLKQNDDAVGAFSQQLAQVSAVLADNREQLGEVIQTLDHTAVLVRDFARDNREQLDTSLHGVGDLTKQLAGNRQALADLLQRAPVGVSNFNNTYDPVGSLQAGAFALTNMADPATFVCSLIFAAGGRNDNTNAACESAIMPFVQVLKMNNIPLAFPLQTAPLPTGGGR